MVNASPNLYPQLPTGNITNERINHENSSTTNGSGDQLVTNLHPHLASNLSVTYTHNSQTSPSVNIAQRNTTSNILSAKAQFQKRLEDNYPVKFIFNYSLLLMITNLVSNLV